MKDAVDGDERSGWPGFIPGDGMMRVLAAAPAADLEEVVVIGAVAPEQRLQPYPAGSGEVQHHK